MITITPQQLEAATLNLQATLLNVNERLILAALILKRNGGLEFNFQAGEILKRAYASEETRVNQEHVYRRDE